MKRVDASMGVAAINLQTGETLGVAADERFPTASLIKTAVMVEAFHRIAEGTLESGELIPLTDDTKVGGSGVLQNLHSGSSYSVADLLYLMIALSDNTATNMLIARLGTGAIDQRMESYGLTNSRLYRPTFRDNHADLFEDEEKEFGLGSSTPREMAKLMQFIAEGKVVSPEACAQMEALLSKQQYRDMIPRRLPDASVGVHVANKTGHDAEKQPDATGLRGDVRTDAGIVTTPQGRYVIAIFARHVRDPLQTMENEAAVAAADVSRMVYDHFTAR